MTKKTINEYIHKDWIEDFDGQDFHYVQMWLDENLPDGYFLDVHHDYDYTTGRLMRVREETNEEYVARTMEEQEAIRKQELREIQGALSLQNKIAILRAQDLSLAYYLEKHKDNPNIGDLENLYIAMHQAMTQGSDNQVIQSLKDCMEHLENV